MKCPIINEEFLQREEPLAGQTALGDAQIHLWEMFHDLARVLQVVLVADEGSCTGVLKNMVELSRSIQEVYRHDHGSHLR
jgi:hypothetical protein